MQREEGKGTREFIISKPLKESLENNFHIYKTIKSILVVVVEGNYKNFLSITMMMDILYVVIEYKECDYTKCIEYFTLFYHFLPLIFKILISPKKFPSPRTANWVTPSSATTASFPSLMMYISWPTSPFLHTYSPGLYT